MSDLVFSAILLLGLVLLFLIPILLGIYLWRKPEKVVESNTSIEDFYHVNLFSLESSPTSSFSSKSGLLATKQWKNEKDMLYSERFALDEESTKELNKLLFSAQDQIRICPGEHLYYLPTCKSFQFQSTKAQNLHNNIQSCILKNRSAVLHVTSSDTVL